LAGTLNLDTLTANQGVYGTQPQYFLGIWQVNALGGVLSWNVLQYPHLLPGLLLFFVIALAETNRAPFDLPESESELVSGYNTEYTGFGFAALMLAEYANMLLMCMLGVLLFLGGWNTPLPNLQALPADVLVSDLSFAQLLANLQFAHLTSGPAGTLAGALWGAFWLLAKATLLVLAMMWIRWTWPRLRPDQLVRLCWQYLTPLALLLVFISLGWKIFVHV
jgi:NADH-quinone oxidoreductase subunit H